MKLPLERQELIGASRQDQKGPLERFQLMISVDFSRFQSLQTTLMSALK